MQTRSPPPQGSGPEEAVVASTDLTYDPADPKSFRYTVVEDLTNPEPPPGPGPIKVKKAIRVRMTIPDPRSPKKLATIKLTAYRRDEPDLEALARAIVDEAMRQVEEEREAA